MCGVDEVCGGCGSSIEGGTNVYVSHLEVKPSRREKVVMSE